MKTDMISKFRSIVLPYWLGIDTIRFGNEKSVNNVDHKERSF
jgi:hypothetical protein